MTTTARARIEWAAAALLVGGLLVATGGACGDRGGPDDGAAAEAGDTTVPDRSPAEALLTAADLDGWTVHDDVEWRPAPDDCGGEAAGIRAGAHVELSRETAELGEVRGVFQDVIAFDDDEAAAAFMAAQQALFAECVQGRTQPSDFAVAAIGDLDLGTAELGDDPFAQQVTFGEPNPFGATVTRMDFVAVRRGRVVSTITTFVPLLEQPDAVELSATVYDRL